MADGGGCVVLGAGLGDGTEERMAAAVAIGPVGDGEPEVGSFLQALTRRRQIRKAMPIRVSRSLRFMAPLWSPFPYLSEAGFSDEQP
jgi:hypothetical protein